MGDRDKRHREAKKPKKASRPIKVEALAPPAEVEAMKKRRARREEDSSV